MAPVALLLPTHVLVPLPQKALGSLSVWWQGRKPQPSAPAGLTCTFLGVCQSCPLKWGPDRRSSQKTWAACLRGHELQVGNQACPLPGPAPVSPHGWSSGSLPFPRPSAGSLWPCPLTDAPRPHSCLPTALSSLTALGWAEVHCSAAGWPVTAPLLGVWPLRQAWSATRHWVHVQYPSAGFSSPSSRPVNSQFSGPWPWVGKKKTQGSPRPEAQGGQLRGDEMAPSYASGPKLWVGQAPG